MISVTTVLGLINRYPGINRATLEAAAERGTLVHAHCLGQLKGYVMPVPDEIAGYVDAFREWSDRMVEGVIAIEHEVLDQTMQIIGHLDLACTLKGVKGRCVIDLKCIASSPDWLVGLQLAAYQHLAEKTLKTKFPNRYALHLRPDGKVHLMPFRSPQDWLMFINLYSLYNYGRM